MRLETARTVVRMRRVGEVAFLVRVDSQVVELVLVGLGLCDRVRLALVDALVTLARHGPELLVVVVAGVLDEVSLPVDVDLGDDGLQVVRLDDRARPVQHPGRLLERAGRCFVALADLVVGREQDRLGRRRGLGGPDRVGEVAPDQRACLLVICSHLGESLVLIDPGQAEQGRDQVGVARRHVELASAAGQKRAGHDERHVQCLLVGAVPLLVHPVVRALQVAVI